MSTTPQIISDGSSVADATREPIDLEDPSDRWRYTCPRGHHSWSRTNNHVFCTACSRAAQHDDTITPEYYELYDQVTGESVAWASLEVSGE